MHKDIYQAIEEYYRSHRDRFTWYFSCKINSDYSSRAEEMTQDVFAALLQAAQEEIPPKRLDAYAWGIARNKLKMLYRSKDWQTRRTQIYDSTHPVSYDEDALCNAIEMHIRAAYNVIEPEMYDIVRWGDAERYTVPLILPGIYI